jgi:hypothetical protein
MSSGAIQRGQWANTIDVGAVRWLSLHAAETLDEILHRSLTAASVADALGNASPANGSHPKA